MVILLPYIFARVQNQMELSIALMVATLLQVAMMIIANKASLLKYSNIEVIIALVKLRCVLYYAYI
jgi:hypothetical protein